MKKKTTLIIISLFFTIKAWSEGVSLQEIEHQTAAEQGVEKAQASSEKLNEPSPFGLEIKKMTYEETKKKYSGRDVGINKYSSGKMYDINCSNISMEGLESLRAIFDKDNKLFAVVAIFQKNRYENLFDYLKKRYKLISNQSAFVGNKKAEFQHGNTKILLEAPHMSFELELCYMHVDFEKLFLEQLNQEKQQKAEREAENL